MTDAAPASLGPQPAAPHHPALQRRRGRGRSRGLLQLLFLLPLGLARAQQQQPRLSANSSHQERQQRQQQLIVGDAAAVRDAINADFTWEPQDFDDVLYDEQPRMRLHKVWEPPAPATGSAAEVGARLPITIFTALTLERLGQLELLCKSWPGPLVASVWLPVVPELPDLDVNVDYYLHQADKVQASTKRLAKQRAAAAAAATSDGSAPVAAGAPGGRDGGGSKRGKPPPSSSSSASSGGGTGGRKRKRRRQQQQREREQQQEEQQRRKQEQKLRLQQKQLEVLKKVLQRLQQAAGDEGAAQAAAATAQQAQALERRLRRGRRLLAVHDALRGEGVPVGLASQLAEAELAVEGIIDAVESSRLSTHSVAALQTQASRADAARSRSRRLAQQQEQQEQQPGTGSRLIIHSASASGGSAADAPAGVNVSAAALHRSAFVSRSTYLRRHHRAGAHTSAAAQGQPGEAAPSGGAGGAGGNGTHGGGGGSGSPFRLFADAQQLTHLPACQLTVMLFVQPFRDAVAPLFLFPINSLRNYAALMARTPLVGMIDVDLSFNARFSQSLLTNTQRVEDLVRDARLGSLLIPPAFEAPLCERPGCSDGRAAGQVAVYSGKPQLQALLRRGWLDTFHCSKGTHWLVDYKHWFESSEAYEVRYAHGAEPWFIGHKSLVPWYDTRFKGFGFNKQLQVLYATGNMRLRLRVLPDAWLIHIPHPHTTVSHAFKAKGQMSAAAAGSAPAAASSSSSPGGQQQPLSPHLSWENDWQRSVVARSHGTLASSGAARAARLGTTAATAAAAAATLAAEPLQVGGGAPAGSAGAAQSQDVPSAAAPGGGGEAAAWDISLDVAGQYALSQLSGAQRKAALQGLQGEPASGGARRRGGGGRSSTLRPRDGEGGVAKSRRKDGGAGMEVDGAGALPAGSQGEAGGVAGVERAAADGGAGGGAEALAAAGSRHGLMAQVAAGVSGLGGWLWALAFGGVPARAAGVEQDDMIRLIEVPVPEVPVLAPDPGAPVVEPAPARSLLAHRGHRRRADGSLMPDGDGAAWLDDELVVAAAVGPLTADGAREQRDGGRRLHTSLASASLADAAGHALGGEMRGRGGAAAEDGALFARRGHEGSELWTVYELLRALYARAFNEYTWPLGISLLKAEGNRLPDHEHPHVHNRTKLLAAQLPWWAQDTARWFDGQPSAVRPPYLDPPAKAAWPLSLVKQLRSKLEVCSPGTSALRSMIAAASASSSLEPTDHQSGAGATTEAAQARRRSREQAL